MRAALVASCLRGAFPEVRAKCQALNGKSRWQDRRQRTSGGLAGGLLDDDGEHVVDGDKLVNDCQLTLVRAMSSYSRLLVKYEGLATTCEGTCSRRGAGKMGVERREAGESGGLSSGLLPFSLNVRAGLSHARAFVCPVKPRTSVESGRAVFPTLNPTSLAATASPLHFCVFF